MVFYLGTHEPSWLRRVPVPLFLSRRRLARLKTVPRAIAPWALDSGGFSELSLYGQWQTTPEQYADEVLRWSDQIGRLEWAAIQDWMCEPFMLAKTGLSVAEHQRRTIESYLTLRQIAPTVTWAPVLQGWIPSDYVDHAAQYESAGVDLSSLPRVGVGSVCRRQSTAAGLAIFEDLRHLHLRLHGFGLKMGFLRKAFALGLESFDSLAWSFRARRHGKPMDGCTHKTCANCDRWAVAWREAIIGLGHRPKQMLLSMGCRD